MKRLILAASLLWAAPVGAQSNDPTKEFFVQVFPLAQESYEVGVGIGCGAVNQKFAMLASLNLVADAQSVAKTTIADAQGNIPTAATGPWEDAMLMLEAALDNGTQVNAAKCASFYQEGGPTLLQQFFPNVPQ